MAERLFTTSIQLEPTKSEELDKIAFSQGKSRGKLIRDIVDKFLADRNSSKKIKK